MKENWEEGEAGDKEHHFNNGCLLPPPQQSAVPLVIPDTMRDLENGCKHEK